jgi:sulfite reductase (NADPH) flavoprotein alpha-component
MPSLPLLPNNAPFADDQISVLNTVMAGTTAEQRAWLSGFLAGYQAGTGSGAAIAPAPAAAAAPRIPLTILFGTESGNAEAIAMQAKKSAAKLGFAPVVVDMADADLGAIAKAKHLMVVAATWGEGDPPERAVDFYAALMADDAPRFDGVKFGVLALGDLAYANFCGVGKRIDARLEQLGGARIVPRVDCDVDFERPAAGWLQGALAEIKESAPKPNQAAGGAVIHVDFAPPEVEDGAAAAYDKAHPFDAEITEWISLNSSRSSKENIHVELSLEGSGILYEPGDSLGILPLNDEALVDDIQTAVGLAGDAATRAALIERHDVTTLTRPLVQAYADLTGDAGVAALRDDDDAYVRFAEGRQPVDLFEAFPHRLTAEQLTGLLRPLPPRLYSIGSSLKALPDQAHLLLAAVRYASHGRDRKGVASTFVADARRVGDRLKVYLKPNRHFRLPADADAPVIMIGPGTGIVPFRAFMQEREAVGSRGRNWLFFGDRNYQHDFLYQLEWQDFVKDGVLDRIDVAFSRDQPEKVYVQDRLWQRRADLYAWLQDGAYFYVCGDEKAMAKDVHAMLARVVADQGGMTAEAAEAYIAELRRAGRYLRDVY